LLKYGCLTTHIKTYTRLTVNSNTNTDQLPPLVADMLHSSKDYIDNLFADTWKELRVELIVSRAGFKKRSGTDIVTVVYLLMLWKWINVSSIAMFSRRSMRLFAEVQKDALYDSLAREDLDWRGLNLAVGKKIYDKHKLANNSSRVFVLDDSIRSRRGKKMEGVSKHFDHVSNSYVEGQQVLTMGLATDECFLALDSQIFISQSDAHPQVNPYKDGRSTAAKRYDEALNKSKVEMSRRMLARAVRNGIRADYVVADAWFGTKDMMRVAMSLQMTGIFRMKKGKLKYRVKLSGKWHYLDAKELYQQTVRKNWRKIKEMPWKAVEMQVEVDLSTEKGKSAKPDYLPVKLLFVRGVNEDPDTDGSKKDWALFLSTDPQLASMKMLEVYAQRWAIEVYFKEAKQHLGFLREQTISFASHTASIHLCAIRYLMLVHAKLTQPDKTIGKLRGEIQDQLNSLSFAAELWQVFRAIVNGTLKSLRDQLGCSVRTIMTKIDERVEQFFVRSLQLDVFTMTLEHDDVAVT